MQSRALVRLIVVASITSVTGCATPTPQTEPATLQQTKTATPPARAGHVLTYDAARQRILLFGGFEGSTFYRDIWQLAQGQWTQLAPDTPFEPRTWQTIVFDPTRQNYVMFGGKTAERVPFGDTWLWDGVRWTEYAGQGPSARSHHTTVFDPHRGVAVLFGGDGQSRLLNDTWEWTGEQWRKIETSGPSPRAAHMSAYDPNRKMVVVAGGVAPDNKTRLQDAWGWDGRSWTRLADLPQPCALGSAVGTSDGVLIFGGWSKGFTPHNVMWRLGPDEWQTVAESQPPPRSGAAFVFLPDRGAAILSGGLDGAFEALSDAWFFTDTTWASKPAAALQSSPPSRKTETP